MASSHVKDFCEQRLKFIVESRNARSNLLFNGWLEAGSTFCDKFK